jgi:uncharacterized alpha-E superfamily protein
MKPAEMAKLASRLERRGSTFVVQDMAPLGLAPVYEDASLSVKPASLRVFAAWTPSGYRVMPGALTRVAHDETVRALSMQSGAASKDTWVLSSAPVDSFSMLQRNDVPLPIRRVGDEAPSRAVDNLFWLGRYAERAENLVRVLRAVVHRLGDDPAMTTKSAASELARRLLLPQGQATSAAISDAAKGDAAKLSAELHALAFAPESPQGLQRLLQAVQRTAWSVRDRLSFDTWRTIHAFTTADGIPNLSQAFESAGMRSYFDTLVRRGASLSGLSAENMTRGSNWVFLDMGRRVERACHAAWLVRQMLSPQEDEIEYIQHALSIADSAMTYRYRYLNVFQIPPAIDLLLLDPTNPRSAAFQIAIIVRHVLSLPKITPVQRKNFSKAIIDEARDAMVNADPFVLARRDEKGKRAALNALSETIEDVMPRLSDAIADAYFQHAPAQRAGSVRREPGYRYR